MSDSVTEIAFRGARIRVHEKVAEQLEEMIRNGSAAPGDRLPSEKDLMSLFGVGRSAVREALLLLQRRGLVRLNSGERAQVTIPDPSHLVGELATSVKLLLGEPGGVRNFQGARALMETALARNAALHATPADIAELYRIVEANRRAINDHKAFVATDLEFHFYLARMSGNALITALHSALVDWLTEQRLVSGRAEDAARLAFAGHERIFHAIQAGDVLEAQQTMQDHLDDVARRYWRQLREEQASGA